MSQPSYELDASGRIIAVKRTIDCDGVDYSHAISLTLSGLSFLEAERALDAWEQQKRANLAAERTR
jgi:hypothetical protein